MPASSPALDVLVVGAGPAGIGTALAVDCPTGPQYARYLRGVVAAFELSILTGADVHSVTVDDGGFTLDTTHGPVRSRTVVWAGGEFRDYRVPRFAGSACIGAAASRAAEWSARADETSESPETPESTRRKRPQGLLSLLAPSILSIAAMAAGAVIGTTAPGVTAVLLTPRRSAHFDCADVAIH